MVIFNSYVKLPEGSSKAISLASTGPMFGRIYQKQPVSLLWDLWDIPGFQRMFLQKTIEVPKYCNLRQGILMPPPSQKSLYWWDEMNILEPYMEPILAISWCYFFVTEVIVIFGESGGLARNHPFCMFGFSIIYKPNWWFKSLWKNLSSSVGIMTFPTYGKSYKIMFQSTKQKRSSYCQWIGLREQNAGTQNMSW